MKIVQAVKELCQEIFNSKDKNFINIKVINLKNLLQSIKKQNISLTTNDIKMIKKAFEITVQSTVDHNILDDYYKTSIDSRLNKTKINISKRIRDNIKISSINKSNIFAVLLSCAGLITGFSADAKDSIKKPKTEQKIEYKQSNMKDIIDLLIDKQGKVKGKFTDENGIIHKDVHIIYDDYNGDNKKAKAWDGKGTVENFIKNCKGTATIGYGITDHDIIKRKWMDDKTALYLLIKQIKKFIGANKEILGEDVYFSLTPKQQNTLIALWYNIGGADATPNLRNNLIYSVYPQRDPNRNKKKKSTLLTKADYLNNAAYQFLDCNRIKGKISKGLTNRVKKLSNIFKEDI